MSQLKLKTFSQVYSLNFLLIYLSFIHTYIILYGKMLLFHKMKRMKVGSSNRLSTYILNTHYYKPKNQKRKIKKKKKIVFNWNHFEMRLLNLRINFYLLRTFCPHLGRFFILCCFFFHYVSDKFHLWPSSGDLPRPRIGMLSLVTVSPVISAFHIETLSLYGSWWALSEDSGFKSYPSRPEVYLVKNVVR